MRTILRFAAQTYLILAGFLGFHSSSAFGQNTNPFFAPPTFSGSGQAISADVNGDGKADLLFFDGTVLLGKADGTFTTGTAWRSPTTSPSLSATQFAIADFNGDGKADIFVAGPLNVLGVMLGNGDGTFRAAVTTSIAAPITSFIVGDLNGDGKPDVLTGDKTYLGKGDGTFAAAIASNAIDASLFDSFVDFNGDGKLDLFISNQAKIQLGNGDGTFQAPAQLPSMTLPLSGIVGDFDGDGKLDILATEGSPQNIHYQVFFGNGDGTFRAGPVPAFVEDNTLAISLAADMNGDGKADLIGANGNAVQVLTSKGNGTFTAGKFYNAPIGGASLLVAADFNGDGKKDVAAFNTMLLGKGDGTLLGDEAVPSLAGNGIAGDFNGDGHPDLALLTLPMNTGGNSTTFFVNANVWLNDGKANFTSTHTLQIPIPSPGFDTPGIVGLSSAVDLNGDGKIDLVGYVWDAGGLKLMSALGHGDGSFDAPVLLVVDTEPFRVNSAQLALGDLNGDGKPDVLITTISPGTNMFYVVLNNGDGTFNPPSLPFVALPTGGAVVGDFNSDKKRDVILPTSNGIGVLLGNGDGTFQPTTFITNSACGTNFCGSVAAGDFDGDGKLDLMSSTASGYQVLIGKGDGTFNLSPAVTSAAFGHFQVADFNGDGKLDVLGSFNGSSISLILGNGDGTFGPPFNYSRPGIPLIADFNGDGRPDLANLSDVQLVWLFNGAGPNFSMTAGSGLSVTVAAGKTASYSLSLSGNGGFSGSVALTCSGAPTGSTCEIAPSSVTLSGTGSQTATVSVSTTAASQLVPSAFSDTVNPTRRIVWIFGLIIVAGIAPALAMGRRSPRRFSYAFAVACCALVLVSASLMAGCGGGTNSGSNSSGSGSGGTTSGTATGTYTITVTATSTSPAVTRTTKLTLIVQ